MHAGSIGQAGVHAMVVVVDRAARVFGDISGRRHQECRTAKSKVRMIQPTIPLKIHRLMAVNQNFCHRRVIQQRQHRF